MQDIPLLLQALLVASEQHKRQTRKDAQGTPYINHPIQVAALLWQVAHVNDAEVLAAAILHDVVEDTGMPLAELRNRFGDKVANLVAEVTDDKTLPKAERKQLQIANAPKKSPAAKLIKLADKTSNVRDILNAASWDDSRKRQYLEWATAVVAGLRGVNPALEAAFDQAVATSLAALGANSKS